MSESNEGESILKETKIIKCAVMPIFIWKKTLALNISKLFHKYINTLKIIIRLFVMLILSDDSISSRLHDQQSVSVHGANFVLRFYQYWVVCGYVIHVDHTYVQY